VFPNAQLARERLKLCTPAHAASSDKHEVCAREPSRGNCGRSKKRFVILHRIKSADQPYDWLVLPYTPLLAQSLAAIDIATVGDCIDTIFDHHEVGFRIAMLKVMAFAGARIRYHQVGAARQPSAAREQESCHPIVTA